MSKIIFILMLCGYMQLTANNVFAQEVSDISGEVRSASDREPLPGATIVIKGSSSATITDASGRFSFRTAAERVVLQVSYLGFVGLDTTLALPLDRELYLFLQADELVLSEVEVVSTGYQEIPRERASGSFAQVGQELVNRKVSTNVMDRLQDITPGVIFNRSNASNDPISIRGRSTIFANTMPLVVIDNFPYDGPLENINPNDVESFTILRDAAAASIWGARAGNGVIVITTKQGKRNTGPRVSLNSNVTVSEEPDLLYTPQMSSEDLIGLERMLFVKGFYKSSEKSINKTALSPVVETLIAERDGVISSQEADRRIADYTNHDVRNELQKHYYRPRLSQQYSLGISGGGERNTYTVSAGYDGIDESIVGNSRNRLTLNAKNTWHFLKEKLEANVGLYYSRSDISTATDIPPTYAYDYLEGPDGSSLPVTRGYSRRFIEGVEQGLLDWNFYPLEEIGKLDNKSLTADMRVNVGLSYKIFDGFRASLSHQYWNNSFSQRNHRVESSYFVRDLINQYTSRAGDGSLYRNIPEGGILDINSLNGMSHNFRAQLSYDKTLGAGRLTALGGYEAKSLENIGDWTRYYGYDDENGVSRLVDNMSRFRRYYNNSLASIPSYAGHSGTKDNYLSWFFNTSYVFHKKYVFNGSLRRDASNLFGVRSNQKAVPLWSVGASWVISEEGFWKSSGLPFLRLRTTYGYNGNVDRNTSAFTTARYVSADAFSLIPNLPYAFIVNPPNPNLRWERIGILNIALDFETLDGRIRSTVEYYVKEGKDLIGDSPVAPSTGKTLFRENFADTRTKGWDIEISSANLQGRLEWDTRFIFSAVNEKVIYYPDDIRASTYLQGSTRLLPQEGKPLYQLLSLPFAGLDPENGNPLIYKDGLPSDDYSTILSSLTVDELIYHGPSRPRFYGSLMNTVRWRNFSFSANMSYRLGYFYRRETVNYSNILIGRISHSDYVLRWQQSGDELVTDVPSMPTVNNFNRNTVMAYGSNLVERGDHIRLQDIRLSYSLKRSELPCLPFQSAEFYTYADNLGILWKFSNDPLDPDFRTQKPLGSVAVGLKVNF
ncbi:SusC/RagA family TonB-linked outer membrane protein [Algoriphagus aquimarinus]|uniref:TonB-linked outer membrane protein, SusC/RagA family n=1 Tax=Algoriphagus aquimarinus TaxID=237018 RepID=A0A1I1APC6_9BACT|nr:SusC/RagA family TonB-linked outer membrane protein [Algoriphagus aquimarinus]SFB39915.1 TonB-linked outer membrane protein, SusC/RagA family [Algoriphagus aquimarinus]